MESEPRKRGECKIKIMNKELGRGHIQSDYIRGIDPAERAREMIVARMAEYNEGKETSASPAQVEDRIIALSEALDILDYVLSGANSLQDELPLADLWRLGDPNYRAQVIGEAATTNSYIGAILRQRLDLHNPHRSRFTKGETK